MGRREHETHIGFFDTTLDARRIEPDLPEFPIEDPTGPDTPLPGDPEEPPAGDPTKPPELMKGEDAAKIVDELLMPDFVAQQNDLTNQIIDVWANNFSMDDIKGLRAFYSTPLGQKLIATLPAVTQQGMSAGQAWGQRVYQATIQKNKDALIARGLRF